MDIIVGIVITTVVAFIVAFIISMMFPLSLLLDMTVTGVTALAVFVVIVYAVSSTIYGLIY